MKQTIHYTPKTIRNKNYQIIFNLFRKYKSMPISNLVSKSHLSKTAIKNILDDMLQNKLIYENGKGVSTETGGKPPILYSINPDSSYSIGCLFTDSGYTAKVFNLNLEIVDCEIHLGEHEGLSYQEVMEDMCNGITLLLERNPNVEKHLSGILFMSAGIVAHSEGVLDKPIPFLSWGKCLPVLKDVKSRLNLSCPMYLDNAVRCDSYYQVSINENLLSKNVAFINYYFENIGGSFIHQGHIMHGKSGLIGEFGHIVTDFTFRNPCLCGKSGCLESVARHSRIIAKAQNELPFFRTSILQNTPLSFASISNAADAGDFFAQQQMDFLVQQFATLIYNLQIPTDPDMIILKCYSEGAQMVYFSQKLTEVASLISLSSNPVPLRIDICDKDENYDSDSVYIGSALFCFDQIYNGDTPTLPPFH